MTAPEIWPANRDNIRKAAELLRAGGLVAFPTETVYGLGADAANDDAVARVFAAKRRPEFNPLIVHVASIVAARRLIDVEGRAAALAEKFWPGPLTLVGQRLPSSGLSLLVSAGLDTAAVRVPAHPIAQALLSEAGVPIAAPSANMSGTVSPTTAKHVVRSLDGLVDAVLDGGACAVGIESTVIDISATPFTLLRPGGLSREEIETVARPIALPDDATAVRAPGMLSRHYAPRRPLRLNVTRVEPGETVLGFGPTTPKGALNLSPTGKVVEAAANLFAMLRQLDESGDGPIAVMPIPNTGIGVAINDRLRRAAVTADDDI